MSECHFVWCIRTCISCPSLTDLELNDNAGLTPFLESMPSLVTASVWFDGDWADREYRYDHCFDSYYGGCDDGSCLACHIINLEGDGCVFLEGLCGATNLKLTSAPEMVCFHVCCLIGFIAIGSCTFVPINRNTSDKLQMCIACLLKIHI